MVVIYIDSPDWIKQKKETTNPKKENDKCFQYAVMVELNRAEIEPHSERVSNIKPFINDYNWKEINYPSKIDDWKTFEKNNTTIAPSIFDIKVKEIFPACIAKINLNCAKKSINDFKRRKGRLVLSCRLSTLLRTIISKHHGDVRILINI